MNKKLLDQVEQEKRRYEKEGFLILGVFGSYARSEENSESDMDILYEMTEKFLSNHTGWDLYFRIEEIKKEIEKRLSLKIDLVNKNALDSIGQYFNLPEVEYVS